MPTVPLLPTTVVGSHALPSWLHLLREAAASERLGPTDLREAYDDAGRIAIRDQIEAGIDVISDGEMRRIMFIRGFYDRLVGLRALPVRAVSVLPTTTRMPRSRSWTGWRRPTGSGSWTSSASRGVRRPARAGGRATGCCVSVPDPCSTRCGPR